jgi:Cysteine-rich secretory protein family
MTFRSSLLSLAVLLSLIAVPGIRAQERDADTVRKTLHEIYRVPKKEKDLDPLTAERQAALRRLKAYRYLARVPYEPLELDDELNGHAQAAAEICAKLRRLDHAPPNPGLAEADYQRARKGAGSSNLAWGHRSLSGAVDGWMKDSDQGNIDRLGHRRWCLNPAMARTGFGRSGTFAAMYSFDRSRRRVPDFDFIAFPARGPMPVSHFGRSWAWSVSLNPKKYRPLGKNVSVKVFPVDARGKKTGDSLRLSHLGVNNDPFGVPRCGIFRPDGLNLNPGRRYRVEIEGLTGANGKPASVRYTTEFIGGE